MHAVAIDRFESILTRAAAAGRAASDETLHDLALDQVFARVGIDAPPAATAFRVLLGGEADVEYRQGVFHALDDARLRALVEAFLRGMGECVRADAEAAKAHYRYGPELWHLAAVVGYVATVEAFHAGLTETMPQLEHPSTGWELLSRHVAAHRASTGFGALRDGARGLRKRIGALDYNALIRGGKVTIGPVDGEPDLGESVLATFERFRQGEVEDYSEPVRAGGMDHVQAWMLELVAKVHPEPFAELGRFTTASREYRDGALARFADEVRFYLACLDYLAPLRKAGLPVCYPVVSASGKELTVTDTWDLALAPQLVDHQQPVVTNDLTLTGAERILVISGPNQGGKTTTARTFGQVHHLAVIGCPIPGRQARVFLCDQVLTVFERIVALIAPGDLLLCNESFASTTEAEGSQIVLEVTAALVHAGVQVRSVTHLYDFAHAVEDDPTLRAVFLRAPRAESGERSYRLEPGPPLRTSYGLDLYDRLFGTRYADVG